jgi:V8-like Glu-specific endopeptidase
MNIRKLLLLAILSSCSKQTVSHLQSINGTLAEEGQFPSVVRYILPNENMADEESLLAANLRVNCTATKIKERLFITAAHCVGDDYEPKPKDALLNRGPLFLYGVGPKYKISKRMQVKAIHVHPSWLAIMAKVRYSKSFKTKEITDIALIETVDDFPIPTMSLPDRPVDVDASLQMVGYGCTKILGTSDGLLRYVNKKVATVNQRYGGVFETDPETNIASSPCFGDSGGPWLAEQEGAQTLYGVTSYGDPPWEDPKTRKHYFTLLNSEAMSWINSL